MSRGAGRATGVVLILGFVALSGAPAPAAAFLGLSELRLSGGELRTGEVDGEVWLEDALLIGMGVSRELGRRTELRLDVRHVVADYPTQGAGGEGPKDPGRSASAEPGGLTRHGGAATLRWAVLGGARVVGFLDLGAEAEYREADRSGPGEIHRSIGPSLGIGAAAEWWRIRGQLAAGHARWFVFGDLRGADDDGEADRWWAQGGLDLKLLPVFGVGIVVTGEQERFRPSADAASPSFTPECAWARRDHYGPWSVAAGARLILRMR